MHPRALQLIQELKLQPHPEGGYFVELYRSSQRVRRADGCERSALTTIAFLLVEGGFSQWHRVAADETWHFYEGSPLSLHLAAPPTHSPQSITLGPVGPGTQPVAVVPAHAWQGARTLGAYTLVGCTVAPGFEFEDFELIDALPAAERPALPGLGSSSTP